jgi:hypothetical protein
MAASLEPGLNQKPGTRNQELVLRYHRVQMCGWLAFGPAPHQRAGASAAVGEECYV